VRVLSVVVLTSFAPLVAGQTVTESEFLQGMAERHPSEALARELVADAQGAVQRAKALQNPIVEATREDPQEVARQTTITLSWVPPLDGRRGLGIDAAEAGLAAAEKQATSSRMLLRLEARRAYAQWAAAVALERVLAEDAQRVGELARRVRARADAGEESALAAGRLDLAAAEVQAGLRAAEASEAIAAAEARAWRPDLPAGVQPELPTLVAPSEQPVTPALEVLQQEAEKARLEEKLAGRFWTFPALLAGWQRQHFDDASGPVFGFAWTIPLFDRNQGGRTAARVRREAADARLSWSTTRVAAALEGRRRALDVERLAADEAGRAAALAAPLVKAATARFEAGEATVTELVEALAAARSAQHRAIEGRTRALAAERALIAAGLTQGEVR
jgi:outer membrane protein TolC